MDNKKTDAYYIGKIKDDIAVIFQYMQDKTYEEFVEDDMLIDAVMFRLVQMVESIKKLTQEFREKHNDVHWREIIGFRNGIVHDYGSTDYTIVYEIIKEDLKELNDKL